MTPEIIYYVACSLDGFIATEDGGVGWLEPFQKTGEDHGVGELQASADALLLGSHTYEFALKLGAWPSPETPSWVFTHRKLKKLHSSITLTSRTPRQVVELLKERGVKRAWLMGGGKLATSFRAEGLISGYILVIMPIILGRGIPVFAPGGPQKPLVLESAKPFKSGIVQLIYRNS
ncbi:MAG TPA: dihydrofolate reductase family protein [Chthoniobacterales bacterium]|nr:dihydrofolate reductase family protein [Chthoniobacterales bacterium]